MPLTKTGKKILKAFQKEYGKVKGTKYFYATMNEKEKLKFTSKWHKKKKF